MYECMYLFRTVYMFVFVLVRACADYALQINEEPCTTRNYFAGMRMHGSL